MAYSHDEDDLIKALAVAMIKHPRATLKELAEHVNISKATLHRVYGTREHLEKVLIEKAKEAVGHITELSKTEFTDYTMGLRELINAHYKERELLCLLCSISFPAEDEIYLDIYLKALDSFFLRGQKNRTFKIEYNVEFLTELFVSCITGLIDADNRGRLVKAGTEEHLAAFFLTGSQQCDCDGKKM